MNTDATSLHVQHDQRQILCLSWEEVKDLTHQLARAICAEGKPDVLIGVQRGGIIPAVMLSHQLAIPDMLTLPIRRTLSDAIYASKQAPSVLMPEPLPHLQGRDLVVVDDIVGSGETFRAALQVVTACAPSRVRSVVCVVNRAHWDPVNQSEPQADLFAIGREVRAWVVFPWEKMFGGEQNAPGNEKDMEKRTRKEKSNGSATDRS